jgi:ankyrin repeat protein
MTGGKTDKELAEFLMHDACGEGRKKVVAELIASGADVNARCGVGLEGGETPLDSATQMGHREIVELLIVNGADVNSKGEKGKTPLDWAILFKQYEIADLLRKHGGKTGEVFKDVRRSCLSGIFNRFKAKAPAISIHDAAKDGNIKAIKKHLAYGTDVNLGDILERTPLYYAATKEIAELLIDNGAWVNAKGYIVQDTPLHGAAHFGHKEVVELLIAKGADVNSINNRGSATPLDYAVMKNRSETADLLRKNGGKTGEELKAADN